MTIVSVSRLSRSDLARLWNNLRPAPRKSRSGLAAVNRSLAVHDESVRRLFSSGRRSRVARALHPVNRFAMSAPTPTSSGYPVHPSTASASASFP